jgi:hypothetical protein
MNHKNKILISIFILITLVFLVIFLLVLPIFKDIMSGSKEIALKKKKLSSIELLAEDSGQIKADYRDYDRKLNEMKNILTDKGKVDSEIPIAFINFFKDQAQELNLALKIVPSKKEEGEVFWDYLNFRIEGRGRYEDFAKFLQKLEYGDWFVKTTSLRISKENNTREKEDEESQFAGQKIVQFDLLIKVYVQKEN